MALYLVCTNIEHLFASSNDRRQRFSAANHAVMASSPQLSNNHKSPIMERNN